MPPRRNKPDDIQATTLIVIFASAAQRVNRSSVVKASYNDLFSRPLAIVGNTGSGKSFSVSSLVQKAMKALHEAGNEPHIFILDINGEYGRAFVKTEKEQERKPDHIYLNGCEFGIPLWFLNADRNLRLAERVGTDARAGSQGLVGDRKGGK